MTQQAKIFGLALLATLLSSCGTAIYQPLGGSNGYTDVRLDANTVRVTYYGSLATSQAAVENFMIYRCAQVTVKYGYDYFIIISSDNTAQTNSYTTPGLLTMYNTNKPVSTGYYMPGQTINYSRTISSSVIKMFSGTKPKNALNAYSAREVIKYLGNSIPRQ